MHIFFSKSTVGVEVETVISQMMSAAAEIAVPQMPAYTLFHRILL